MWKLAFKNLLRDKRRTLLTFGILTVAITYYIVITGMLGGFEEESIRNFIALQSSHMVIRSEDFNEETLEGYIENPWNIENKLEKYPFVKAYTERLKIVGFLDNGIDQYPVVIVGIDPKRDTTIFKTFEYAKTPLNEGIWIGASIKKHFNVEKGDYLFLNMKGKNGVIVSRELEIKGILKTPDFEINNSHVYIDINFLRGMGNFKGEATEINILTDNFNKAEIYKNKLISAFKKLKIGSWMEEGADFLAISRTKNAAQGVLLFFIILIGIIGTANTLLISVFEKTREIGTLKAIGMTDGEVMKLFLSEGFLIGVAGSLSGVIIGVLINWHLVLHGIDWSPFMKDMDIGYKVMGIVKNTWNIKSIIFALFLGPLTTTFASYFPSKRAMKMTPAECLRWV